MALGDNAYRSVFAAWPTPGLLLDTDLTIADVNDSFVIATSRQRSDLVGRWIFDAFPDSEGLGEESQYGISLCAARATGRPDRLPLLRYPVVIDGASVVRWWSVVNIPLVDADERVVGLITAVDDVTEMMAEQDRSRLARAAADDLQRQASRLSNDLSARRRDVQELRRLESQTARRLAALAEVALELAATETVADLTDVVIKGLTTLGASGGAVGVPDAAGTNLQMTMTSSLGEDARRVYSTVSLQEEFPATVAVRTGQHVLLADRAAGVDFSTAMAEGYATFGGEAWAAFPLQVADRVLGSITVSWDEPQDFAVGDVELAAAFAAQCAQALDRLLLRQAERSAAQLSREMSESLQRSLLTRPVESEHFEVAVRYVPAVHEVQVGGDWYDAFFVGDGSTQLVVGDVSGHGREAAASMAQVRNVLRGIAHTLVGTPAEALGALDRALEHLSVGNLVTAVLAKIEQTPGQARVGASTLCWSNAGHPPPVLINADGTAELLERPVDRLLGVTPRDSRRDHTTDLPVGTTVLFYTDGLVERRGVPLDDGFEWLRDTAAACVRRGLTTEQLCDELVQQLGADADDDAVILAVRTRASRVQGPEGGEVGVQVGSASTVR